MCFPYFIIANNNCINITVEIDEIINSKRKGFKEVLGKINAQNSSGQISLTDNGERSEGILIKLTQEKQSIFIHEINGMTTCKGFINQRPYESIHSEPLQSEISYLNMESIFSSGDCKLPNYFSSYAWHKDLVSQLNLGMGLDQSEPCPIT